MITQKQLDVVLADINRVFNNVDKRTGELEGVIVSLRERVEVLEKEAEANKKVPAKPTSKTPATASKEK